MLDGKSRSPRTACAGVYSVAISTVEDDLGWHHDDDDYFGGRILAAAAVN